MTLRKLTEKYQSALQLNNRLMAEIAENGGGATGMTATFAVNASKDLARAKRQIWNALTNGDITIYEYRQIIF